MNIKERNKQIKKVLSKKFGSKNVSVRGARGTATGWVYIDINAGERLSSEEMYTDEEKNKLNRVRDEAERLIQNVKFYTYIDDMNYEHKEYILQTNLS